MLGEAPVLCHLVLVDAVLAASRGEAAVAREQPVRLRTLHRVRVGDGARAPPGGRGQRARGAQAVVDVHAAVEEERLRERPGPRVAAVHVHVRDGDDAAVVLVQQHLERRAPLLRRHVARLLVLGRGALPGRGARVRVRIRVRVRTRARVRVRVRDRVRDRVRIRVRDRDRV